jgi:hypothetical protein
MGIWKLVVWRPFAVLIALYSAAAALAFIRDDVLPAVLSAQDAKTWQSRLAPQLHFNWYWWVIGVLVALLILVLEGVLRVVRKERTDFASDKLKLTTEIQGLKAERGQPDFRLTVNQASVGAPTNQPTIALVWLDLTLLNRGMASIAENWRTEAIVAGVRRPANLIAINDGTQLTLNQQILRLDASDAIYQKTISRIETGAQVSGWLCLRVDSTTPQELYSRGNAIEVSVRDFRGNPYSVIATLDPANSAPFRYFPGSGSPALKKKKKEK